LWIINTQNGASKGVSTHFTCSLARWCRPSGNYQFSSSAPSPAFRHLSRVYNEALELFAITQCPHSGSSGQQLVTLNDESNPRISTPSFEVHLAGIDDIGGMGQDIILLDADWIGWVAGGQIRPFQKAVRAIHIARSTPSDGTTS
jgi:hypothetical protein